MKILKEGQNMKKNFLFIIVLVLFCGGLCSACNSSSSIRGSFVQSSYILSLDDEAINFYDQLKVKGIKKDDVELNSSNVEILTSDDGKSFSALKSGKSFVLARYQDKVIAKAEVNVKYKLSQPRNVVTDDDGVVSWDESFIILSGGQRTSADSYKVVLTGDAGTREFVAKEPSFTLDEIGVYQAEITALSNNNLIDASLTGSFTLSYGFMERAAGYNFVADENFMRGGTLSWNEIKNAKFNVSINGLEIASQITENRVVLDLDRYSEDVEVEVEVVDAVGTKRSVSSIATLKTLETPSLSYLAGEISFEQDAKALSQVLQIENVESKETTTLSPESSTLSLHSFETGFYNLKLISVGGTSEEGMFITSCPSEVMTVYKLEKPVASLSFDETFVHINFENTENKNYEIFVDETKSAHHNITDKISINISALTAGEHTLKITNIPAQNQTVIFGDKTINAILRSDTLEFDFAVPSEFEAITHSLSSTNTSTLSFQALDYANKYVLMVNGNELEFTTVEEGAEKQLSFDLTQIAPIGGQYILSLTAYREENGEIVSLIRKTQKTLTILPIASLEPVQENGSLKWQAADNADNYFYYVYQTDSNFENANLIASDYAPERIINFDNEGYYKVLIASICENNDEFLNSDFYDKNNLLSANVIVNKAIQTPEVTFTATPQNTLLIKGVEKAGEYEIYVDGTVDGSKLFSEEVAGQVFEYKIANAMTEAKEYSVEVIAKSGTVSDAVIYVPSLPKSLTIKRLAMPSYNVRDVYDRTESLLGQEIIVSREAGCQRVQFSLNGLEQTTDDFSLAMTDSAKYGSSFNVGLKALAAESTTANYYYIDSQLKAVNFERAAAPTQIKYAEGNLSWQNGENGEKLYITIKLAGESDYYRRFFTQGVVAQFDLQAYINNARKDVQFDTAYRHSDHIEIELLSYANVAGEGKHYISSFNGSTTLGLNKLTLSQLDTVSLTADQNKTLMWEYASEACTFEIYLDDVKKAQTSSKSYDLTQIIEDFTISHKLQVKVKANDYLDSELSSPLFVKEVVAPTQVLLEKSGEEYIASISIEQDTALIESVLINASADNVNYTKGGNVASFNLKNFSVEDFTVQFIAINEEGDNYYFNSQTKAFKLIDLASASFACNLEENALVYNSVADDISGNNIWPIEYTVTVLNNGNTFTKTMPTNTSILLDEIETLFNASISGEVMLSTQARVSKHYTLSLEGGIGYYGATRLSQVSTLKLDAVDEIAQLVVDSTTYPTAIENKLNASLQVTFADKWATLSDVRFTVTVGTRTFNLPMFGVSFVKDGSNYVLTLPSFIASQFSAGSIAATIQVKKLNTISSDVFAASFEKYPPASNVSISDDGVLSITGQSPCYMVEVSIEDRKVERQIMASQTLDLKAEDILGNKIGDYTVRVLGFDPAGQILPSESAVTVNGHKMEGISALAIDEYGRVNISLHPDNFDDIVFVANYISPSGELTKGIFNKRHFSGADENTFFIMLIDLIELLRTPYGESTVSICVRKIGSLDSDYKDITFNYQQEGGCYLRRTSSLDEDYVIFSNNDYTSSIMLSTLISDGTAIYSNIVLTLADAMRGYWVTGENGEAYFSTTRGAESNLTYEECFGVSLNKLLLEQLAYPYGHFTLKTSRFAQGTTTQYSSSQTNMYKLCTAIGSEQQPAISIKNDILTINWTQIDLNASGIAPNAFIIYISNASLGTSRIVTFVPTYDLRNFEFVAGEEYTITVKAISNNNLVLASDLSEPTPTLKYSRPMRLEVKNGRLQFNEEEFKNSEFFKDVYNFFATSGSEPLFEVLRTKTYTSPYYFSPLVYQNHSLNLCFVNGDYEKIVKVPAFALFPDIVLDRVENTDYTSSTDKSYISLLYKYKDALLDKSEANDFVKFIESLYDETHGIGDDEDVIDDYARDLPAGDYRVKLYQPALDKFVTSAYSNAIDIYISPSPQVELLAPEGNETSYRIKVTPSNTKIDGITTKALVYKMMLRAIVKAGEELEDGANTPSFILLNNRDVWTISYQGEVLDGVLTNADGGFIVNMSALKKACTVDINRLYVVDIFAYACDNTMVVNGKSGRFELQYLDLDYRNISFEDGKFIVENTSNVPQELIVRYYGVETGKKIVNIEKGGGRAQIELDSSGNYSSVILSFNGSVSSNRMVVESATYLVKNLYKLSSPIMTVQDGIIYIQLNDSVNNQIKFELGNNISFAEYPSNKQYYYSSEHIAGNVLGYEPGRDESELRANEFYAYLCGNSGEFSIAEGEGLSDYVFNFSSAVDSTVTRPIMSSALSSLQAKMIEGAQSLAVEQGDLKIANANRYDTLDSDVSIVYKVEVNYYIKDNMTEGQYQLIDNSYFYTEKLPSEDEQYFNGKLLNTGYNYFTFNVFAVAARRVDGSGSSSYISTIEGNKFTLSGVGFSDGIAALRSLVASTEQVHTRSSGAYSNNVPMLLRYGRLNFVLSKSEYLGEDYIIDNEKLKQQISVYAEYKSNGIAKTLKLEGDITGSLSTNISEEDMLFISFTPHEGQLNDAITSFVLKVYAYSNNKVISAPFAISDVYKLASVENYYKVVIQDERTALDFNDYFENTAILGSRDYYKIVVTIFDGEQEVISANELTTYTGKTIVLPENAAKVEIYVCDGQDATQVNPKKVISSDTLTLEVQSTGIDDLRISWNNVLNCFEWSWINANSNNYEYIIDLISSGKEEKASTYNNFYYPQNRGTITRFALKARIITDENHKLYLFSPEKAYNGDDINYDLFSGGNGSKSSPYIISNLEDFKQIKLRNTSEFYFKLNSDLTFSLSGLGENAFIDEFNGHLDGGFYTINVTLDRIYQTQVFAQNLLGKSDLKFNYYSSIFKTLSQSGEIKNMVLSYAVNCLDLDGKSIMISPLCAYNKGTIENVNIRNATFNLGGTGINNVFASGVVAVNLGVVSNCVSYAAVDFSMPQKLSVNFGYAAIAIFNINEAELSGNINNCFNKGNVKVSVAYSNNLVYVAGVAIHSSGTISTCGNDGELTLQSKTTEVSCTGYFSGIAITSSNGTLEYLYNNGKISSSARGTFNYSGVVHRIYGGTINTLVETCSQPITKNFENRPTDRGINYAGTNSGTSQSMNVKELTTVTIDCGNGKKLYILENSSRFVAKIDL